MFTGMPDVVHGLFTTSLDRILGRIVCSGMETIQSQWQLDHRGRKKDLLKMAVLRKEEQDVLLICQIGSFPCIFNYSFDRWLLCNQCRVEAYGSSLIYWMIVAE